jgi:Na+-transporting methylmalonyl-CoA/oxaloacetate decarboxylase gamma subunit
MFAASEALIMTLGIGLVFFVAFPLLVHGLLGFVAAQVIGEKRENEEYARTHPKY